MLKLTFGAILKTRLPTTATVSESRVIQPLAMQWYSEKAFQPNITFEELQERIQAGKPDSVSGVIHHIKHEPDQSPQFPPLFPRSLL
ncbi:unnamed protein product [Umbelopsis ramanniana]